MARPGRDEESNAMLFQGANVTELALLFGMERRDIQRKIYGVPPSGKRNAVDVWAIKDVAPHLVKPTEDMVSRVLRMNHADLPGKLKSDYWAGEKTRLQVEQLKGRLWPVEMVVEYASAAFKDIRVALLLLADGVEREAAFSETQREILKRSIDGTLAEIQTRIDATFTMKRAEAEPDEMAPFTEIEEFPEGALADLEAATARLAGLLREV